MIAQNTQNSRLQRVRTKTWKQMCDFYNITIFHKNAGLRRLFSVLLVCKKSLKRENKDLDANGRVSVITTAGQGR